MRRRRFTGFVLSLACVLLVGAASATAAEPDSDPPDRAVLAELRATGARVARHAATGQVRFVGGSRGHPIAGRGVLGHPATPLAAADRFLARYGSLFGVANPGSGLRDIRSVSAPGGGTFVRYQQVHRGVPVLGGDISVQVADGGDVISAIGEASPGLELGTEPQVAPGAARTAATAAIAKARRTRAADLSAAAPELWVYDPALLGGRGLPFARLVWRTEVTNRAGDMRELVLVDALRGNVALHFDQIANVKNRLTCDGGGTVSGSAGKYPCTSGAAVLTETTGTSSVADVNNAHKYAGHTYDFFFNRFGRDSLDGAGMALKSTVRYCPNSFDCPMANAFWDGSQMVYGTGFANADDVVGHELAHGVTQFTAGLFYYYQSGAINEALSDIFGEFIDLTNGGVNDTASNRWLLGEDIPSFGPIRDMENPGTFNHPDRMTSSSYTADAFEEDGGGVHHNSGVANKAAFLIVDGGSFNGQTITGLGIDKAAAI
ncbi:MAG TPA: M4 family metallopeptidase, partial [Candidatus Caenarcaniphilales bacterium]|nr:M4 family metallopeptidase [Candidatus Caenarcaniphilales bacterium]